MNKNIIIALVVIGVIAGAYFLTRSPASPVTPVTPVITPPTKDITKDTTGTKDQKTADKSKTIIGTSVEKRDITAYHYGTGATELMFVGGIHGGYEWNTALVAYELMDYLKANPNAVPKNMKVTVIPVLNPDGLNKVVGTADRFTQADVSTSKDTVISGRFNANGVDLNRNFDCDWQAKGVWQDTPVSGGSKAFSEQESQAIKSYIETNKPTAVVVWYSAAGGVFSSSCHNGVLAETKTLTNTYAAASGYKAYESFDFYETTGDMVNWLAKKSIPAISVLLSTHNNTEWSKNKAGIEALLKHYTK
jgi:hypothetical protein